MTISDTAGEFGFSVTSTTYERQSGGGVNVCINIEGTATGFGQVNGTLTLIVPGPGATSGPATYAGASFQDSGEVIGANGEGCWNQIAGEQKWRVRGLNLTSNGGVVLSDGTIDLATRAYNGTINEWT